MEKKLLCPIPNCDYTPRKHRNRDNPTTAKDRLYAHIHLNHRKEEIIRTLFLLMNLSSPPLNNLEVVSK